MKTREEQLRSIHDLIMSMGLVQGRQPPGGTRYVCPLCNADNVLNDEAWAKMESHHEEFCLLGEIVNQLATVPGKLYAFWKYDQFPYVLGGEVRTFLEDGSVTIQGYGGMAFTPVKVVPLKSGLALREELNAVKEAYRVDQQKILEDALRKLDKVAPWATQRK